MFDKIQHIGYLVDDLDKAAAWFARTFGAESAGGGKMADSRIVPGGGRNAFVRFGAVEVELMQPTDITPLPKNTLVMHHVGYVAADIAKAAAAARSRGLKFLAEAPYTNHVGQEVLYFDPDSTNGMWMHLTKVPPATPMTGGPRVDGILHPGYRVRDIATATAWFVDKLGGKRIGGGKGGNGGQVAYIDCGQAQVELIEPPEPASMKGDYVLDHVGYIVPSIKAEMSAYRIRMQKFATEEPLVNPLGQKLIYFDNATAMGTRMHLTELPA